MWRMLALLFVAVSIVQVPLTPRVWAQPGEMTDQQRAAEFRRLYDGWRQARDPEARISLGERALAVESALTRWPLWSARDRVKGDLLTDVGHAYQARSLGLRADNLEKAITHYEAALAVRTRQAFPQGWAEAHNNLGAVHADRIRGERADNVEMAIAHYQAALTVRTRQASPKDWALTQDNLGIAYEKRIHGERADNLETAIAHYEAALTVRTRQAFPQDWALTQKHLASAYLDRVRGERADNLEKAIAHCQAALTVYIREVFPHGWASTQNSLAIAYLDRIRGERADNLEKAIAHLEAALSVNTAPEDWARRQNNLANAYLDRIRGEQADNLEKAIAHYEAALTVRTREALPPDWATTQNNLAIAYTNRVRGERADNLEVAIAHFEAALSVRTREALPQDWAYTQNNFGVAYLRRIREVRADNLEKAIACFEAALTVRTREALPWDWATTQINLATAYSERVRGERADNLEKAIAHFEAALAVFGRETSPKDWATIQHNLANAHRDRVHGERLGNLQKAIAYYEAALKVFVREAFPREHLLTARLLGGALLEAQEWHKAGIAYAGAREAFLVLFGEGPQESQARDLIARAGPLFAEAAFAASQRGESEMALTLASEGRARLIAVALKVHSLDLPADQRRRVVELRTAIRVEQRAADSLQGTARAAALEWLITLRRELLGLVKGSGGGERGPELAVAEARAIVADGGAVVAPILTKVGSKIVVVTDAADGQALTILDLPKLTTDSLNILMRGDTAGGKTGGWLGTYSINYLPADELERRWSQWLAAIGDLGFELWTQFGARLDAALKDRGVKPGARIIWMPSGALGILPLGLAQDPASKRRIADDYEIAYAPSLEALMAAHSHVAKARPATLAAIINPTGDLDGTEKEGTIVASHFAIGARTILEGRSATPEAVLAALRDKTHWHFASHGTFSWDDARQSALVMHDRAPLSVGKLLEADELGRPRLVVLSACETGLYDIDRNPDEFVGLPGAFTTLGAAGVVGTLWPVSDAATALLIAKFYELHMGEGFSPPTALSRAQAWLRTATSDDLQAYARLAVGQGRLEGPHLAEIERDLSAEALARSRNQGVVEWITQDTQSAPSNAKSGAIEQLARPYAHPYFWAGFIHTGL